MREEMEATVRGSDQSTAGGATLLGYPSKSDSAIMSNYTVHLLTGILLVMVMVMGVECDSGGREGPGEKSGETDSSAMESRDVKVKTSGRLDKAKRADPTTMSNIPTTGGALSSRIMFMPPVSLMIAMPHPSGRFLMLFPASQMVSFVPMPYAQHHDHPATFAARHQMLYSGPTSSYQPKDMSSSYQQQKDMSSSYQQLKDQQPYQQPYSSQFFTSNFINKRAPIQILH